MKENFDKFSRVSIRRLGRLLPDARWVTLLKAHPNLVRNYDVFFVKHLSDLT